jgi:ATPase subunit of ABC transporter with duplicated ATPase domains
LLLDEPTNDLISTHFVPRGRFGKFSGCAVVISHDRWFLDRICTHILAFEGNSEVYCLKVDSYEENKKKRLGGDLTPND